MKVCGYVRVSTEEQSASGAGLEAQRQAIAAECERRGWELAGIVEDAGYSAKDLNRPGIARVLADLDAGQVDGLVVAKVDRLSRSLTDFAAVMERSRRRGWTLTAIDLGVDTSTPSGELLANVLATFAHFERRLIGERTKAALAVKRRAEGIRTGPKPMITGELADRIVALRDAGETMAAIANRLNAEDVATAKGGRWYASTIDRVLRREHEDRERKASRPFCVG